MLTVSNKNNIFVENIFKVTITLINFQENYNRMKTLRQLLGCGAVVATLLFSLCACAENKKETEDDFADAVMELVKLSGQSGEFEQLNEKMLPAMQNVNKTLLAPESASRGDELAMKYIDENMEDKMLKPMFADMLKGKLTIEEIDEITEKLKTEKGRTYNEHFVEMTKKVPDVMQQAMGNVNDISNLKKAEYTCPEEYAKKFAVYYENGFLKKSLQAVEDMMQMLIAMGGDADEESKKAIEGMMTWMKENYVVFMANAAFGTLTDEDIAFGTELNAMPAFQKYIGSLDMKEVITNSVQLGMDFANSYKDWLAEQEGVKLKK